MVLFQKTSQKKHSLKEGYCWLEPLYLGLTHPKDVSFLRAGTSSILGKETGNWEELKRDHPPQILSFGFFTWKLSTRSQVAFEGLRILAC